LSPEVILFIMQDNLYYCHIFVQSAINSRILIEFTSIKSGTFLQKDRYHSSTV